MGLIFLTYVFRSCKILNIFVFSDYNVKKSCDKADDKFENSYER